MTEQFANRARTTLSGGVDSITTTIIVASATLFPTSGTFRIVIDDEIMIVTAVSGATFTVTRGAEGTTAASHANGSAVAQLITAGSIRTLQTVYDTFANRPVAGNEGRMFIPSNGNTPWIDDGSTWRPLIGGCVVGTQPPLASGVTIFNQGGASLTDANGALYWVGVNDGSTTTLRGFTVPISGTNAFVETAFSHVPTHSSAASTFSSFGACMRESSTSRHYIAQLTIYHTNHYTTCEVSVYTSHTARTVNVVGAVNLEGNLPYFLRLRRDSTNLYADMSRNRQQWVQLDTRTIASVFTTAPDQGGCAGYGYNVVNRSLVTHFVTG
jgi:hypothetical protein